jgi:hypothetical protein
MHQKLGIAAKWRRRLARSRHFLRGAFFGGGANTSR